MVAPVLRVTATPTVGAQLARYPGLRERVEETHFSILETAIEIRRLGEAARRMDSGYLRVRVRDFMVSYTLNLDEGIATIVFAEKIQAGRGGNEVDAA